VYKSGRIKLAISFLLVHAFAAIPALATDTADELFAQGKELYEAGKYDEACKTLKNAIGARQKFASAHQLYASALMRTGNVDEALKERDVAISIEPDNATYLDDLALDERWLGYTDRAKELDAGTLKLLAQNAHSAEELIAFGRLLDSAHRRPEAKQKYEKAIALCQDKTDFDSLHWLAIAQYHLGNEEKAVSALRQAQQVNPQDPRVDLIFAVIYGDKHLDKSIEFLTDYLKLNPRYPLAWLSRGYDANEQEHYNLAIPDLDAALKLYAKFPYALAQRGRAESGQDDYEKAETDLKAAVQLTPNDADNLMHLAQNDSRLKHYSEAIAEGTRAVTLEPTPYMRIRLGWIYCNAHRYKETISECSKALALSPKYEPALTQRGCAYCRESNWKAALSDLLAATALDGTDQEAFVNLGWAYSELNQGEKALKAYETAIKLDPKDSSGYYARAGYYRDNGKYKEALPDLDKVVSIIPKLANGHCSMGSCLSFLGKYDQAIAECSKAIALNPKQTHSFYTRGYCFLKIGQLGKARSDLTTAISQSPNYTSAYEQRAVVYRKLGSPVLAQKDEQKVAQLKKANTPAYRMP
jgi:tetratricopeptide (TPR) repeat protein